MRIFTKNGEFILYLHTYNNINYYDVFAPPDKSIGEVGAYFLFCIDYSDNMDEIKDLIDSKYCKMYRNIYE